MYKKLATFVSMLTVTALIAAPALAARTAPIYNPEPIAVPAGRTADQVKSAVRKALLQRNWRVKEVGAGAVEAKYVKPGRRGIEHVAAINVTYNTKTIRISYKDSQELNYDKESGEIHANYNKWIQNLEKDIQINLESF